MRTLISLVAGLSLLTNAAMAQGFTQITPAPDGTSAATDLLKIDKFGSNVAPAFQGIIEQLQAQPVVPASDISGHGGAHSGETGPFDLQKILKCMDPEAVKKFNRTDGGLGSTNQSVWR